MANGEERVRQNARANNQYHGYSNGDGENGREYSVPPPIDHHQHNNQGEDDGTVVFWPPLNYNQSEWDRDGVVDSEIIQFHISRIAAQSPTIEEYQ